MENKIILPSFLNPNKKNLRRALVRIKFFLDFCIFFKLNLSKKIKHSEKFVSSNKSIFEDFESNFLVSNFY